MLELVEYLSISIGMALAASTFMVLAGLFSLVSGAWLLASILLAGGLVLLLAASLAELAALFPGGGGVGAYLKAAFGEKPALFFMLLYLSLVGGLAGLESSVFSSVLDLFLPGIPPLFAAFGVLSLGVGLNLIGLEFSRRMQIATTAVLVLSLAGLSLYALAHGGAAPAARPLPTGLPAAFPSAFPAALGLAVFLFMGFEWVTPLGRNPKAYARLIPGALCLSVAVLAGLYALFACALMRLPGGVGGSAAPQVRLSFWLLGAWGGYGAAFLSLLAMLNCFNAGLLGASRMVYLLARQGHLPAFFARLSPRSATPRAAIGGVGLAAFLSAGVILHFRLHLLVGAICSAIECFVYAALVLAVLTLRRTRPTARRPFRTPLPAPLQGLLAAALVGLGGAALLFDMRLAFRGIALFLVLGAASAGLAWLSPAGRKPSGAAQAPRFQPVPLKESLP